MYIGQNKYYAAYKDFKAAIYVSRDMGWKLVIAEVITLQGMPEVVSLDGLVTDIGGWTVATSSSSVPII